MKLQAISAAHIGVRNTKNVRAEQSTKIMAPYTVNFRGNPNHVIFYGAEYPDYDKKGGVANVMSYYDKMPGIEPVIVQPYYRGRKNFNANGQYTGEVIPHKFGENCKYPSLRNVYFYSKINFDENNIETATVNKLDKNINKGILVLEELASKNVVYGAQKEQTIKAFLVKKAVPVLDKEGNITDYKIEELTKPGKNDKGEIVQKKKNHVLIYSKGTAEFKEPYDDGSYSSDRKGHADAFSKYKPQPYAENNRAFVDLMSEVCAKLKTSNGEKFEPSSVVCSDSQTAYTISFMRDEAVKEKNRNEFFKPEEISPTYVIHNLRRGYTGECGGLEMALNLGLNKDEIDILKKDPDFIKAQDDGTVGEYFEKYLGDVRDGSGAYNPTKIAFKLRNNDYVTGLNTVSKGYCEDLANNTNIPTALRGDWKELVDAGKATGILNPFEDPGFHIFNGVAGMVGYTEKGVEALKADIKALGEEYTELADSLDAFSTVDKAKFPVSEGKYSVTDEALENLSTTKNINKRIFLNRLTSKFDVLKEKNKKLYNTAVVGLEDKNVNLIGRIDENLLAPDKINDVKVYTSWGRLDSQKSLDIVMNAFDKFCEAHPEEKDKSVLVLGGNAPGTAYSDKILGQAEKLSNKYPGHVVFMEAFAPNKILASVAEQVLLPSREAPCELTDVETMQFLTMLTATRAQGMDDKNFDPDNNPKIATSFKTPTGYYLSEEEIEKYKDGIGEAWKKDIAAFRQKVREEKANRQASAKVFKNEKTEKTNETLEDYISANPQYQKEYEDLLDKYRSLILTSGVAFCMERGLKLTNEQKKTIFTNQLNLKAGWENNSALTGLGKSSAEAYKEFFNKSADTNVSKYSTSFLNNLRAHLEDVKKMVNPEPIPEPKPIPKPILKYVAYTAVAAGIIGGAAYAIANRNSSQNNVPAFAKK